MSNFQRSSEHSAEIPASGDWYTDLMASRDLSEKEKQGYGFLLAWFDTWRMGKRLETSVDSARRFWKREVTSKPRKTWQLAQWAEAVRWYLQWLKLCEKESVETVSQAEKVRDAVERTGARRGLALRTRKSYGSWAMRFAQWAGSRERVLNTKCAHATQKQALNALVFLYRDVCGMEEIDLGVPA